MLNQRETKWKRDKWKIGRNEMMKYISSLERLKWEKWILEQTVNVTIETYSNEREWPDLVEAK